jgi:anti-sigma28 factor (negative regulator of flagellin synthesis)
MFNVRSISSRQHQDRAFVATMSLLSSDGSGDGVASQKLDTHACQNQTGVVMSSVNSIGPNSPLHKIVTKPVTRAVPADAPVQQPAVDKLELSGVSHLLQTLKTNDIRADKVAQIKAQIEAGTYETDDKLDIAADRLLDDLLK